MEDRKTIYLCLAHMSEEGLEQKYVKEAFDTNWIVPLGPNVNAFEADLEAFVNELSPNSLSQQNNAEAILDRRVVCLSAGTAAVHLALVACGVKPGDEVCVQSFTFCASSHPITYLGAKPVFIDSEPDSWNMDPDLLEKAIIDRIAKTGKKPKAIIPVALYGMPYNCDKIMAIAEKYNIPVIEDAAEGFGSRFNGRVLGTFGKFGVLSFNGTKMITTSGGGALICVDDESKNNIMWYATQARDAYPYYQHTAIGYNYRMSNVCAGIGRGQMSVANAHIAHHKHVQELYRQLFKDIDGITLHEAPNADYDSNYWLCTATIDPKIRIKGQENVYQEVIKTAVGGAAGVIHQVESAVTDCQPNDNVEPLRIFMLNKRVECRPLWKPMHKQPIYCNGSKALCHGSLVNGREYCVEEGPNMVAFVNGISEGLFKIGVCLPAGPMVTDDDVRYIVDCIRDAIER